MARQILIIKMDKNSEEIHKIMEEFLIKNGYKNKEYNGEEVLVKNAVPGFTNPQYMKIYIKDGVLKVVAWIKAFGNEFGVDDDFVACVPKKELKGIINSIIILFNATEDEVINRNTIDKEIADVDDLKEAKYELNPDMKTAAIVSLVLGIIMFLCLFIPFPVCLAFIFTISGIVIGATGIKSSLKALAIIGIVLCSIDTLIYLCGTISAMWIQFL